MHAAALRQSSPLAGVLDEQTRRRVREIVAAAAYHRINFRAHDVRELVMISNRLAIMGLGVLALAIVGVMVLIGDVLFGTGAAIASGTVAAALFAVLWAALPLRERRRARGQQP